MSARMGSCSCESSWGSASGLAHWRGRMGQKRDGAGGTSSHYCPPHPAWKPSADHQEPHVHPMFTWHSRRLSKQLSKEGAHPTLPMAPTHLAQDIHGQVHQPQDIALVPGVQQADVVRDVIGAALHPSHGGILKPAMESPRGSPQPASPHTVPSGPSRALVTP